MKAASKLAAAPSWPPASNSKTPVAVHCSTIPTTSSPIESTEAAGTVPDCGGPKKKREREKKKERGGYYWQVASANRIQKLENELQKRSL